MEKVVNNEQIFSLKKNKVIIKNCSIEWLNSEIVFQGIGNQVYFLGGGQDKITLEKTKIRCLGNNNIIIINDSKYPIKLSISAGYGCSVYIGENIYSANTTYIITNEMSNVYIGNSCLLARDVWLRTSDMHLIYDIDSGKRINPNGDILIGEHVWLGQNVMCLKGTKIGSGSIIGLGSICAGEKTKMTNCIYSGQPAQMKKEKIFWIHKGTNSICEDEVISHKYDESKQKGFIYSMNRDDKLFEKYRKLSEIKTSEERAQYLIEN